MELVQLSLTDAQIYSATHKVMITYSDVAALGASATGTLAIVPASGTFPIGTQVGCVGIYLETAFDFSDAAINSLLVEIGDGGSTARLLTQTEIAADGSSVVHKIEAAATQPYAYVAADTVDAKFTASGGASATLAECTSGKLWVLLNVLPRNTALAGVKGKLT